MRQQGQQDQVSILHMALTWYEVLWAHDMYWVSHALATPGTSPAGEGREIALPIKSLLSTHTQKAMLRRLSLILIDAETHTPIHQHP